MEHKLELLNKFSFYCTSRFIRFKPVTRVFFFFLFFYQSKNNPTASHRKILIETFRFIDRKKYIDSS